MARASTKTLLALDTAAKILGIDPWSFNGMKYPKQKSAQCADVIFQYPYQRDHLATEEFAQAIADSEQMIADETSYWPAPTYITDESVLYPHTWTPDPAIRKPKALQLKWHHVISGGVLARTHIGTMTSTDITTTDPDSDNNHQSFTAVIDDPAIGSITDPNELALYFAAASRLGEPIGETWRIRPVTVEISGDIATFTGHRTLLVDPVQREGVDVKPLDPNDDGSYVSTIEVYRLYTDTTSPLEGVALWNNRPGCQTPDCGTTSQPLCLAEANYKEGMVYSSFDRPCPPRRPDRVTVNYLAGLALVNSQMQPEMARVVTYLAVSLLANENCGCDRTNRILAYWKQRLTSFEDEVNKAVGFTKSDIPFPVTRGGLFAWERVRRWRNSRSVAGLPI